MEDDYLLNDDDDLEEDNYYLTPEETNEDEDDYESDSDSEDGSSGKKRAGEVKGVLSDKEVWLSNTYDDIVAAAKNNKDNAIEDVVYSVVYANPVNTSATTRTNILKELLHKQGHSRMQNSIYTPTTPLTGEDVLLDLNQEDDSGFNHMFAKEAKSQIARFIDYLASRDLSKDTTVSRNRKLRQIPAFIIFLFSSGMYDLIINCPTMPPEYDSQITKALEKIMKSKYDLVEELARKYEEAGRPQVAEVVRKMQVAWFYKEPAEIRTAYKGLDLTYQDVVIYREYRSKFTNTSKAITQDVISDLILVINDTKAGTGYKLKDKTRAEAIDDVKKVYREWSKDNPIDSDLASKVIWKEIDDLQFS